MSFGTHFIGRANEIFTWWQTLHAAPVGCFLYWIFYSGFKRFRDEDVIPR